VSFRLDLERLLGLELAKPKRQPVGPRAAGEPAVSVTCPQCGKTWISATGMARSPRWVCPCGWSSIRGKNRP
jgi:predicted RNA-binding Zn-ribbon protein involved in translation (DUF1610 family)